MNIQLALERGVRQVWKEEEDPVKISPLLLADDGIFAPEVVAENFGDPETEGRWTLGTSAQISFTICPHQWPHGLELQIFGRPMEIAEHLARVSIRVNESPAIRLNFSKTGWTSFLIPIHLEYKKRQTVICRWLIENPFSPLSHGESDDHRLLGMLVGKLELRSGSPAGALSFLAAWKRLFKRFLPQDKSRWLF